VRELAGYERHGAVVLRAAERRWLDDLGLAHIEHAFALQGEPRSEGRSLVRLNAPGGRTVFVKRWDFHRAGLWLRGAVKLNIPSWSGPRELRNLLALRSAGIRAPLPLAAGEIDEGPRRRSFVALARLEGEPLERLPAPAAPAARRARIQAVAGLIRDLHGAGFWHKDLYLCNVFLDPEEGLGLLDCERVERAAGGPPMRWRVKDLAALDYSANWPTQAERLAFLRAYLGVERLGRDGRRLAAAVRRKARRIARQGAKGS
jgi:heptose I phosphotransferase